MAAATASSIIDASTAVGSLVQHYQKELGATSDACAAAAAINTVLNILTREPANASCDDKCTQYLIRVPQPLKQLFEQRIAAHGWQLLRACFYAYHFEAWASAALSACEACCETGTREGGAAAVQAAAEATLQESPADAALRALVGHLSSVQPAAPAAAAAGGATVSAAASGLAAALLSRRFAQSGGRGIRELVALVKEHEEQQRQQEQEQEQQQEQQQQQQGKGAAPPPAALRPDSESLAGLLAAAADRAQHVANLPGPLAPEVYALHAAKEVLLAAAACSSGSSSSSSSSGGAGEGGAEGALLFAALVLQRLASRGHAGAAAKALLQLCSKGDGRAADVTPAGQPPLAPESVARSARGALLAVADRHAAAFERLLLELLLQGSRQARVSGAASGTPADSWGANGIGRPPGSSAAAAAARELLLPLLRARHPVATYACAEKLLTRRSPPPAAQALLLSLLAAADERAGPGAAPAAASGGGAAAGSLLEEALLRAARAWSDAGSINTVPLPQQAAASHALAALLGALPVAGALGGGAAPLILEGVGARLGSPLQAVRRQGMLVGRAFAAKLDPCKPPPFDGQGDLEQPLPEEIWWVARAHRRRGARGLVGGHKQGGGGDCGEVARGGPGGSGRAATAGPLGLLERLAAADAASDSDDDGGSDDDKGPKAGPTVAPWAATPRAAAAAADGGAEGLGGAGGDGDGSSDEGEDEDDLEPVGAGDDLGSEVSLEAYDLSEDLEAEDWLSEGKVVGLQQLAAALRKQEDVKAVLDALGRAEVLLRSQPDELPAFAPELSRALLHCRVPDWADREAEAQQAAAVAPARPGGAAPLPPPQGGAGLSQAPDARRRRAMAALLSLAPLEGGDALLSEVYSPHLDQYQRLLAFDALCAAAREMSDPRLAPRLERGGAGAAPRVAAPPAPQSAARARATDGVGGEPGGGGGAGAVAGVGALVAPGMREQSTRVNRPVSLAKIKAGEGPAAAAAGRTFRNRFSPVALRWASSLLVSCDAPRHAVDLFGRDSLLLGRLLATLGTFMECVDQAPAAAPLAAGVLELLRAPQVHAHPEVFVRRCALTAAAQVVAHLPPARLAGAMVGGGRGDSVDDQLVERLEWARGWALEAAASDSDEHCRLLAAGCAALQARLASEALSAAGALPNADGLDPSGLLLPRAARRGGRGRGGSAGAGGGVVIQVPSLEQLRLA